MLKHLKKQFLIFTLIFTILFGSFYSAYHQDVIIVKASSIAEMLSLLNLGLYTYGVSYYGNGTNSALQNDVEIYAKNKGVSITDLLSPLGTVYYNVVNNAIKFTKTQLAIIYDFIQHLINKNAIVVDPSTSVSIDGFSYNIGSATILYKVGSNFNIKGYDFDCDIISNAQNGFIIYFVRSSNSLVMRAYTPSISTFKYFFNANSNSSNINYHYENTINEFFPDTFNGTHYKLAYLTFPISCVPFTTENGFPYYLVNNHKVYVFDYNVRDMDNMISQFISKNTGIFNSATATYSFRFLNPDTTGETVTGKLVDIDTNKDLVVSVPNITQKANTIAKDKGNNTVTVQDIANAIDSELIGDITVGDSGTDTDEDDVIGVITPDITIETTQDETLTDEFVDSDIVVDEEVVNPNPPDEDDDNVNHNLASIANLLKDKFPFSMLYNFLFILGLFDASPDAPNFDLGFTFLGTQYSFNLDFAIFDNVARILRLMEILSFIALLSFLTYKYLRS